MLNPDNNHFLVKGSQIHWYEIDCVLGQGGFGITYAAIDTNLKKKVAIKEFFPSELAVRTNSGSVTITTQSGESKKLYRWGLTSFLREAQTLANFKHKNIVFVYSVFEANNTAYMVMEYLEGQSLREAFKLKRLLDEESLRILTLELMDGLQLVHRAGFIHRDIKPSNIILRNNDEPVLLDFGSARRAFGSKTLALTKLVSSGYSPFEQYSDVKEDQGPWTDIYAMAATLYKAITGISPVDSLTRANKILTGKEDPLKPASEIVKSSYSPEFLEAIDWGLALQPKDRPQTVGEWTQKLVGPSDELTYSIMDKKPGAEKEISKATGYPTFRDQPRRSDSETRQVIVGRITRLGVSAKRYSNNLAASAKQTVNQLGVAVKQSVVKAALFAKHVVMWEAEQRKGLWITAVAAIVLIGFAAAYRVEIGSGIDSLSQKIAEYQAAREKRNAIEALLDTAEQHLADDRLSKPEGSNALEAFRDVFKIDPANSEASEGIEKVVQRYLALAAEARSKNQFDRAEKYLNDVNRIVPDSETVQNARAELSAAKREFDQKQIEDARKLKQVQNLLALAEEGMNADGLDQADKYLQEAGQILPGNDQIARVQSKLDRLKAAKQKAAKIGELLVLAQGDLNADRLIEPAGENALTRYQSVLELDSENRDARAGVNEIALRLLDLSDRAASDGQLGRAEQLLQETSKLLPGDPRVETRLAQLQADRQKTATIEELLTLAQRDLKADRLIEPARENALKRYQSVLELDAENREAREGIDRVALRMLDLSDRAISDGQFGRAEQYLQETARLLPGDEGVARAEAKLAQSKATRQKVLKIDKLLALAQSDLEADRLVGPAGKNALEKYRSVLELDPQNRNAREGVDRIAMRMLDLSDRAMSDGQFVRAEQYLKETARLLPGDQRVAEAEAKLAQLQSAQQKTAKIEELLALAQGDLKADRLIEPTGKNALNRYQAVLELDPENRDAREGMNRIARRMLDLSDRAMSDGQFGRAEQYLKETARLLPGDRRVAEAEAKLAQLQSTQQKTAKVKELLALAQADLKADRLIEPAENNALDRYQSVLELDSENRVAREGIDRIALRLLDLSARAIADGETSRAEQFLQKAAELLPGDERVARAGTQLAQIKGKIQKKNQIEDLLATARQDVKSLRLTSPAGNNALERYRSVIELDPGNQEARSGIQKIVERYVRLADKAIGRGQYDKAGRFLDRAESVSPDEAVLVQAKDRLQAAIAQAERLAAKEKEQEERLKDQEAQQKIKKQNEIQALFDRAERNFRNDYLTSPPGDNALDQYRSVLQLDPGNLKATRGIQRIGERYIELAGDAQRTNQLEQADKYLRQAEKLIPSSSKIRQARSGLSAAMEKAKNQALAAEKAREKDSRSKGRPEETRDVAKAAEKSPPLAVSNLFGSWCGTGYTLKFANNNWTFVHSSGSVTTFPVNNYQVAGDKIVMYWNDKSTGNMVTEFGNFSDDRTKLIQLRGKVASDGNWHYYNRSFNRCR